MIQTVGMLATSVAIVVMRDLTHQQYRQVALPGHRNGSPLLGLWLDAELVRQALLVGSQGQARHDHRDAALVDHGEQVHPRQGIRVHERLVAAGTELDGHRIMVAALQQLAHLVRAGAGDVDGTQQGQLGSAQPDIDSRFLGFGHGRASGLGTIRDRSMITQCRLWYPCLRIETSQADLR